MAIGLSLQRVIRFTSCLVLGWGFRGRRIERRYLRFEQIQDGGHRHVAKISNGHISATGRPIHFMFGLNKFKMAAAAILDNFKWPYLRNRSRSTYLCDSTAFLLHLYLLKSIGVGHFGPKISGVPLGVEP